MRWLPLVLVSALVVGVLVASDPAAVGLRCGGPAPSAWTAAPPEEFIGPCRLRGLVDGDTLDLDCGEGEERIRLLRIDTPEREEPGYREATAGLRSLVRGAGLRMLLEEKDQPVRDRHGRLLAYVYAGDLNVNVEMVRRGWSAHDARFGAGRFAEAFAAAEREARAAGRGLWPGPGATQP